MDDSMDRPSMLTYEDYASIPDDGKRHEILDGEHYVSSTPEIYHQHVSGALLYQLHRQMRGDELGEVFTAPLDVKLSKHDIVQPDLIVISAAHAGRITDLNIEGSPDLVIEILSKPTEHVDRIVKRARYERCGVPEYWIVNPWEHVVEQYRLRDGRYELVAEERERIAFGGIAGVVIDLTAVW